MIHDNRSYEYVTAVQDRYTDWLMQKPCVVGVSVGLWDMLQTPSSYCLVVLVSEPPDSTPRPPEECIPNELEGVPVRVMDVGTLTAGHAFAANG